jgi:hypothetical protein
MREIKYMAWHKKYERMYEVSSLHMATLTNGGIWATVNGRYCIDDKDIKIQIQPNDIILMQYTGFKDGTDTEIYEDYLLENENGLVRVLFDEENGWYAVEDANFKMRLVDYIRDYDFEVIGSIYENSEFIN